MNLKTITLIILTTSLFSCKSSKLITTREDYTKLHLDFKSNDIFIIDERTNISEEDDIKLPVFSLPKQNYDFHPKLNKDYKNIIINTIRENSDSNSQNNSTITVFILDAKKDFSATLFAEKELVAIKLKLVIEMNGDQSEIVESAEFYRKSMDINYKKFEKLFRRSLKEVTYNALKKTKS